MEVGECIATEAPKAPVTKERKIGTDLEKYIAKPYVARALQAPDVGNPDGTKGYPDNGMTVLQQHVAFFDLWSCLSLGDFQRFMPVNLENMFTKYALTKPDNLSLKELWQMTEGNRAAFDYLGWMASKLEWLLLYYVAKDKQGSVQRSC
ncbi:hypothetical protein ES332_D10G192500v1 [Gossypium tomentosum]|uniref:Uncharacterized protein n=1 Tax=Gossypium tomentosum TaxID=34277 RepID=A0A5D2J6W3_GOSTO|nr:hypothetical protein ES332_D10G192500v1 [Gossypium tomentosum]